MSGDTQQGGKTFVGNHRMLANAKAYYSFPYLNPLLKLNTPFMNFVYIYSFSYIDRKFLGNAYRKDLKVQVNGLNYIDSRKNVNDSFDFSKHTYPFMVSINASFNLYFGCHPKASNLPVLNTALRITENPCFSTLEGKSKTTFPPPILAIVSASS